MPVSRIRKAIEKPRTSFSTCEYEKSSETGVSTVVSRTSSREIPSMPTL